MSDLRHSDTKINQHKKGKLLVHKVLECCGGVRLAEQHYEEFLVPIMCPESDLMVI